MSEASIKTDDAKNKKSKKPTKNADAGSKWETWGKIATAITAFLLLATTALGLGRQEAVNQKDEATARAEELSAELEKAAEAARKAGAAFAGEETQLNERITELEEENAGLRRQLGLRPSPSPDDAPPIWHEGPLAINTTSRGVDLDAPQDDPQWGREPGSPGAHEGLTLYGNGELGVSFGSGFVLMDSDATYEACRSETNYSTENIVVARLSQGAQLCTLTSEGRYGVLTVETAESENVSFNVVIWDDQ